MKIIIPSTFVILPDVVKCTFFPRTIGPEPGLKHFPVELQLILHTSFSMPLCPSIISSMCSTNYNIVSYPQAGELTGKNQVVFSDNLEGKQILAKWRDKHSHYLCLTQFLGAASLFWEGKCIFLKPRSLSKRQISSTVDLQMKKETVRDKTKVDIFSMLHAAPRIQSSEYVKIFSMHIRDHSFTITLLTFIGNTDMLTFCYFLSSIPFNRRNCAFYPVQCKITHWLKNKQCLSKFAAVFWNFGWFYRQPWGWLDRLYLLPQDSVSRSCNSSNGAFQVFWICLSAFRDCRGGCKKLCSQMSVCVRLDDTNITLKLMQGFSAELERVTDHLQILFFCPNLKWKVQVLKIHSSFVLSEKKEIDFKSNGTDSSLEHNIMRS